MENNHIHEIYHTIEDTFDYLGKKWSIKIIKGFFSAIAYILRIFFRNES